MYNSTGNKFTQCQQYFEFFLVYRIQRKKGHNSGTAKDITANIKLDLSNVVKNIMHKFQMICLTEMREIFIFGGNEGA